MKTRIAIMGVEASFHDLAARHFSRRLAKDKEVEIVPCRSFPLLCNTLKVGNADIAVMAIENSIAGSILPNYGLLEKNGLKIISELYLKIELHLMALPGQKLENIRTIKSHPMALIQCESFLLNYPQMKILEGFDTAQSAQEIREGNLSESAAIANSLSAKLHGLEILEKNIQSRKDNFTRFLALCRNEDYVESETANKASISFETPDRPGSLFEILEIFKRHSLNMTHLQSVAAPGLLRDTHPGQILNYSFHVDLEWSERSTYEAAMKDVAEKALNFNQRGVYPRGEVYE